jgi:hypothetical protein
MKPVTEAIGDASCDAPKKTDSKLSKEFQGKLSHASPQVITPPITKFFTPRECILLERDGKAKLTENIERETFLSHVVRASPRRQCGEPAEPTSDNSEYHLLTCNVTGL